MRLLSAHVRGVGRLVDTKIKLDQKLVAVVGPNEAGKSTLLKALAYVDSSDVLAPAERSRASADIADSTTVVSLRFRVSEEDQAALKDLELAAFPYEFIVSRRADGEGPFFTVRPTPAKSEASLIRISAELLAELATFESLEPLSDSEPGELDADDDDGETVLASLNGLQQDLDAHLGSSDVEANSVEAMREMADEHTVLLKSFARTDRLRQTLAQIGEWVDRDDPKEQTEQRLWSKTPDIVLFTEADRNLASTYTLDDALLGDVPAALTNVARLAGLNLRDLVEAVRTGQIGRRDTIKNRANRALADYFKLAWKQSDLKVQLNVEGKVLRIGIVEDDIYGSVFSERSAGLRMFVALTAFLAARDTGRPTILLIDEAETHLHIDAQADLVQMFAQQDKADKIIYTTHSPACLPSDLGVGIRAVVPDTEEISYVENSFWRLNGDGFTPLMFAMGASAAAFNSARRAVVTEGATDMILLPTLMRVATERSELSFQVTSGLAEMPVDAYPQLDFQAAKVAFLVDGDDGGKKLAKAIGRAIPDGRVVHLGGRGIENTLDENFYSRIFIGLLRELNREMSAVEPPNMPDPTSESWSSVLETWAKNRNWRSPSKQEVASHIIERDDIVISPFGKRALELAHDRLVAVFDPLN